MARHGKRHGTGVTARADLLAELHAELQRAYEARDGSPATDQAWARAAGEFNEACRLFYEPYEAILAGVRNGRSDAIEEAVRFLVADPWVPPLWLPQGRPHARSCEHRRCLLKWWALCATSSSDGSPTDSRGSSGTQPNWLRMCGATALSGSWRSYEGRARRPIEQLQNRSSKVQGIDCGRSLVRDRRRAVERERRICNVLRRTTPH